jgi:hypothetical protein
MDRSIGLAAAGPAVRLKKEEFFNKFLVLLAESVFHSPVTFVQHPAENAAFSLETARSSVD